MRDALAQVGRHSDEPRCGWSVGAYGAIAEFMRSDGEAFELTKTNIGCEYVTARGGLRVQLREGVRTIDAGPHGVAYCLQASEAAMGQREVITELGPDTDAIQAEDHAAVLFDLGVGAPQVDFCVRTGDPGLIEVIRASEGQRLFASDNPAIGVLLEASPDRVCISRIARIEVYQQIAEPGETTPDGPHTHLLPELIMKGLAYDPAILIPGDMVPCLIAHPENRAANLK